MYLRKIAPKSVLRFLKEQKFKREDRLEFRMDRRLYVEFSTPDESRGKGSPAGGNLEAQLTKDYHRVEKGLSFPEPRRPFGADVGRRLAALAPLASESRYGVFASEALIALNSWNEGGSRDTTLVSRMRDRPVLDEDDLAQFFSSRHSVRTFDPARTVSREELRRALEIALTSPSVCNRQSGRVRFFHDPSTVRSLLSLQNGNAGFRDQIPAVAIITVDRRLFTGITERNQRWIDGGLFAMTLVWGLHAAGVASCMLNWSVNNKRTDQLRAAAQIPRSEDVICMIAIGHAAEEALVARSPRRSAEEVSNLSDY